MKKFLTACSIFIMAMMLTACASTDKQTMGMAAGGVVGGVAGHALTGGSAVGTVAGAVGGAYVGHELAK